MLSIENQISVAVSDVADSCLFVQPSSGTIIKYQDGRYGWNVITDSNALILSLFD